MLKYIELKSGQSDKGPAWIAQVKISRSGTTVYFNGKALRRGGGVSGNHFDVETGRVLGLWREEGWYGPSLGGLGQGRDRSVGSASILS